MKIFVRTDGHSFTIPVPTSLIPFTLKLGRSFIRLESAEETERLKMLIDPLCRELKAARRNFGHMELVHVRSADGDEVIITL